MQQWNPPEYGYSLVKEQHEDLRRQASSDRMSKARSTEPESSGARDLGPERHFSMRHLFQVLARGHHLHLAPRHLSH